MSRDPVEKLVPLPSSPQAAIDILKGEMNTTLWEPRLLELMKLAADSDKNTWSLLYQIMREADSGRLSWGYHKPILSGVVYVLSYVGDSKSYRVLLNYVKSLDRPIPIGAMELISDLLPTFAELDTKELFQLGKLEDQLKSAFAVLALCKLSLESRLSTSENEQLISFLKEYKNYKYYLDDRIENTLEWLEREDPSSFLDELTGVLD